MEKYRDILKHDFIICFQMYTYLFITWLNFLYSCSKWSDISAGQTKFLSPRLLKEVFNLVKGLDDIGLIGSDVKPEDQLKEVRHPY